MNSIIEKVKALNADRSLSIPALRAELTCLESLSKSELAEVVAAFGYSVLSEKSRPVMLKEFRTRLEGIKLSQHRADRIMNAV